MNITLLVSIATSFCVTYMGSAVAICIPAIGAEFGSSPADLGAILSAYILASAALALPFGRFADLIGHKRVIVAGIFLFALTSLLCGTSTSMTSLLVGRALQGISSAMLFSTITALLVASVPPSKRGVALGLSVAATYTGLSVGPVFGGIITNILGWRWVFISVFALVSTIWIPTLIWLKEATTPVDEPMDWIGTAMYIALIIFTLLGISSLNHTIWAGWSLGAGLMLLIAFIMFEGKKAHPLIKVQMFVTHIGYTLSNLAALINYSATFAIGFLMSLYLQKILHLDPAHAGFILLSQPVMMAIFSPIAGKLADRIEAPIVASIGMGISALGILLFCTLNSTTPLWSIVLNLMLIGIGFAFFSSPNSSAIMGAVAKKDYGVAASVLATMRLVGQAVSMTVVTLILTTCVGTIPLNQVSDSALLFSIHVSFILFTVLCGFGILASLKRGNLQ